MWESLGSWLVLLYAQEMLLPAAEAASSTGTAMTATSPFTDYTAAAITWVLMIAFLVAVLLIGGILIVNLGLMSKRPEDHIGRRTPSDVGILKHNVWPEEASESRVFPAEEEEDDREGARMAERGELEELPARDDAPGGLETGDRADEKVIPPEGMPGVPDQSRRRSFKRPA